MRFQTMRHPDSGENTLTIDLDHYDCGATMVAITDPTGFIIRADLDEDTLNNLVLEINRRTRADIAELRSEIETLEKRLRGEP